MQVAKVADRSGSWFASPDPNGSTIGPTPLATSDGGASGSAKALRVSGRTSQDNGAWGVIWGASFADDSVYDASKYAGISFKAKIAGSSSKMVRFKVSDIDTDPNGGVCKSCWNHFGKDLTLTTEWQDYKISFTEMKQEAGWGDRFPAITPSKLFQVSWSVGPGQAFDVWIDDIAFTECQ